VVSNGTSGEKQAQYEALAHALDTLNAELDPTWRRFSVAADHIEDALRASNVAESSRVLPAGVAQLQPLTECKDCVCHRALVLSPHTVLP
jgi:hypothetical protein